MTNNEYVGPRCIGTKIMVIFGIFSILTDFFKDFISKFVPNGGGYSKFDPAELTAFLLVFKLIYFVLKFAA